MSQENVEVVRAAAVAYNDGDLDALMALYDPEVEFVTLLLGTHHGKAALRPIFEENRLNLSGYRLDPDELIDAGDKVIAVARMGGAGPSSGISLDDRIAFVATLKERNSLYAFDSHEAEGRRPQALGLEGGRAAPTRLRGAAHLSSVFDLSLDLECGDLGVGRLMSLESERPLGALVAAGASGVCPGPADVDASVGIRRTGAAQLALDRALLEEGAESAVELAGGPKVRRTDVRPGPQIALDFTSETRASRGRRVSLLRDRGDHDRAIGRFLFRRGGRCKNRAEAKCSQQVESESSHTRPPVVALGVPAAGGGPGAWAVGWLFYTGPLVMSTSNTGEPTDILDGLAKRLA
jgi:ketosteroid isomerase-like protein